MLKIPAIDLIDGQVVRLFRGDYGNRTTYSTEPLEQARRFEAAGFRRIHVVDLEGAKSGEGRNRSVIRELVRTCRIPVQIGGGIRTVEDVAELIEAGARYLILGTSVLKNPREVGSWIRRFGPDHFIVSLDLRGGKLQSEGWLEESSRDLSSVLQEVQVWGVNQIICTDVERDGTLENPNYTTYALLLEKLWESCGLIAAGGISQPEHLARLREIGLAGAIIGRALYEGNYSWEEMLGAG